jgi:hypothetical protein
MYKEQRQREKRIFHYKRKGTEKIKDKPLYLQIYTENGAMKSSKIKLTALKS